MSQDFRCNPYTDIYQDVFKCETANYRVSLGYDDVNGDYPCLFVIKDRKQVEMTFDDLGKAMQRIFRFMNNRPVPQPRVYVNY